jgi:hypothetical protein
MRHRKTSRTHCVRSRRSPSSDGPAKRPSYAHRWLYHHFLQEYGEHVWNIASGPTITTADIEQARDFVQLELDESFFGARVGRATQAELAYLSRWRTSAKALPLRRRRYQARQPGPKSVAPTRERPSRKA